MDDKWKEWLGQYRAEQAIVAAQDPTTILYSNTRVPLTETLQAPLLQPQATRTLFGESLRVSESLRSRWANPPRSHLHVGTEATTSGTSFTNQSPLSEEEQGARNSACVNESSLEPLARKRPWNPTRTIHAPRDFFPTWITPRNDADDRVTGSDESTVRNAVDGFYPAQHSAGRH